MRVVALLACAACWTDPPPSHAPVAPVAVRVVPREHAQRSVWIGEYLCTQGLTSLALTIETRGETATAVFAFGPVDSNPLLPNGSYRMTGTMLEANGVVTYRLDPEVWIDQPFGYVMVGLVARVEGDRLIGRIVHEGCDGLLARRAR